MAHFRGTARSDAETQLEALTNKFESLRTLSAQLGLKEDLNFPSLTDEKISKKQTSKASAAASKAKKTKGTKKPRAKVSPKKKSVAKKTEHEPKGSS